MMVNKENLYNLKFILVIIFLVTIDLFSISGEILTAIGSSGFNFSFSSLILESKLFISSSL